MEEGPRAPACGPSSRDQFGPRPSPNLPVLLVSACLLGVACNHEGRGSRHPLAAPVLGALRARYRLIPICPEVLGGLSTPRDAAELLEGDGRAVIAGTARVVTEVGDDVTAAYRRGASAAVTIARATGASTAVLKARSPSCGSSSIYDGNFRRQLAEGWGVAAAALRGAGVEVSSDEDPLPG